MRISIDCRYIRNRPSGIGRYVQALVDRLPSLAPQDQFHFWVSPTAVRPLNRSSNVSESLVRAPANGLRTLLCPSRLADLNEADVLHAPFNILGRGIPCATVVTLHDLIWYQTPLFSEGLTFKTPYDILFFRCGIGRALRKATRIVAISQATADSILSVLPEAGPRLRVIPHGSDPFFSPPRDPEAARKKAAALIGGEFPYLLVVGQNAPFKNHDNILRAFAAADLDPSVRLVMVQRLYGSGSLKRLACRLGLAERVVWLQGLEEEEVRLLLQSARALIQFSFFEGFGMPVLEAMACGTPVVASRIPPLVEILGGAGVTVPLEVSSLARMLEKIVRQEEWQRELAARSLERARALSWERSAALHYDVYREAANEKFS